jgi:hypothetical protein
LISSPCTVLFRKSAPMAEYDVPGPERILNTFAVTRYFGMGTYSFRAEWILSDTCSSTQVLV